MIKLDILLTEKVTNKKVQLLLGVSKNTATKYIRICRQQISKKDCEMLTFYDFCNYYGVKI